MGGTCTNDGCVPTRVLARAARLMSNASQYAGYGMTVPRPELDFQQLLARTQAIVYEIHEKKQLSAHLEAAGVQVYADVGEARFVDPHTVALPDGRQMRAGKFILAAGGRARRLDFPGEELALTHSDIWRLQKLPRSVAVVGGAATGCQLAAIFNAFGSQVTVLDVAPHILTAEDRLVAQAMTDAFERRGIDVITGIGGVERIERAGKELALVYKLGGGTETLVAEAVVLSTGWLGNLDGLNLAAAGVETDGRYVLADRHGPHLCAAHLRGRRHRRPHDAGAERRLRGAHRGRERAAGRALPQGIPDRAPRRLHPARIRQRGPTEEQARKERDVAVAVVPYADLDRAVIDGRTEGFCKLIVDRETHRLVAAHVVGEQALEIVHVVAAGIAADMWVEQLAELQIAYPTFTAILGLAARRLVAELGVTPSGARVAHAGPRAGRVGAAECGPQRRKVARRRRSAK